MNTTLLKRFATEARNILLQGVTHRLEGLGFDLQTGEPSEKPQLLGGGAVFMGKVVSEAFYARWMSLYNSIRHRGVRDVAEEAAYTWFNRLIAIRILSKQGFISPVLQYESEDIHIPLIVSEARHGRMPEMNERTRKELDELLNDDSKTNEQFALLIVAFCHSNPIINRCFGTITDYTELLLPQDILREGGYVDMLNHTPFISDEDYGSSTLIGWLYQFYISDRKDEVFAKKGKYDADEIAPATQIFTPEWIVEYMVQNTIGRIYLDNNSYAADDFSRKWKYLVEISHAEDEKAHADNADFADNNQKKNKKSASSAESARPIYSFDNLEDLRFADLGCGSGHIVGYMFEVLFDLYLYEGYSRREAVEHILKENLTGVDIDQRAKQLATFALLLKACQKDKSFADAQVMPNILDMPDPFTDDKDNEDNIIREQFSHFILGSDSTVLNEIVDAIKLMDNAKTLGSIMKFNISERTRNILQVRLEDYEQQEIIPDDIKKMMPYVRVILALTEKYTALVMNPPYMGSSRFDSVLSKYVKDNYADGKADLFSVFMLMAQEKLVNNGKYSMINMQSWMFLSSFELLRENILESMQIDSMLHLGPHTFDELSGEVVQNVSFVVTNHKPNSTGSYYRLVDGKNCAAKEQLFLSHINANGDGIKVYYHNVQQDIFFKIPEERLGYWLSSNIIEKWDCGLFDDKQIIIRQGLASGDNDRFIRNWAEISFRNLKRNATSCLDAVDSNYKWFPFHKGGESRKWYGNSGNVIAFDKKSYDVLLNQGNHLPSKELYFKEGIIFSRISSKNLNAKYTPSGFIFDGSAPVAIAKSHLYEKLGYMCSNSIRVFLEVLAPTLTFQVGDVRKVAYIDIDNELIRNIVKDCIHNSKLDWDAHETSWDFAENPLVAIMKSATTQAQGDNGVDAMRPRREGDASTALSDDYQSVVATLPKRGSDATKARYDDYQSAVHTLQCFYHPADGVESHGSSLKLCVDVFKKLWEARFYQLHENEEELNRQFIDIYGLQDELSPDVPLDEITILQQGEKNIKDNKLDWNEDVLIKQLISYAVGVCMGRYRLDKPGLHIAYPNPSEDDLASYEFNGEEIKIDDDAIIPLMPSSCPFNDNMLRRLIEFVRIVFGGDYLTDNLNFMEKSLGMTLEQYLQKDYWKDHKKMYQNRPIYWLFSSKKGAFQCITYMHRMDAWTVERVRTKYLLPYIEYLVKQQEDMQADAANLTSQQRRELDKITKQIAECREYHDRLHDVADKEIAFDLDDGVVVNYAKFGNVLAKIK